MTVAHKMRLKCFGLSKFIPTNGLVHVPCNVRTHLRREIARANIGSLVKKVRACALDGFWNQSLGLRPDINVFACNREGVVRQQDTTSTQPAHRHQGVRCSHKTMHTQQQPLQHGQSALLQAARAHTLMRRPVSVGSNSNSFSDAIASANIALH